MQIQQALSAHKLPAAIIAGAVIGGGIAKAVSQVFKNKSDEYVTPYLNIDLKTLRGFICFSGTLVGAGMGAASILAGTKIAAFAKSAFNSLI